MIQVVGVLPIHILIMIVITMIRGNEWVLQWYRWRVAEVLGQKRRRRQKTDRWWQKCFCCHGCWANCDDDDLCNHDRTSLWSVRWSWIMMMMILVTMLMTKFTWVRKWTADGKGSPQCGRIVLPSLPRLRWLPLNIIFIVIIIIIEPIKASLKSPLSSSNLCVGLHHRPKPQWCCLVEWTSQCAIDHRSETEIK